MGEPSEGRLSRVSLRAESFINSKKLNAETLSSGERRLRSADECVQLVGGGFGGGVHAVLGDFVDTAGGRLDALAIEMIERDTAFADGVALFDGFGDVSFGEGSSFE